MIEVYLLDASCFLGKNVFDKYYQNVSAFRKEKIDKYNFVKDKNLSLGASVLIDFFLQKMGYSEKNIEYSEYENGKPYFKNLLKYNFSISHSIDKVMVCFSDQIIGCDVEKIDKLNLDVAKRFFTDREYRFLKEQNEDRAKDCFYKIWTAKESFLKAIGTGINKPLNSFEIDCENNEFNLLYDNKEYYFYEINSFSGFKSYVCSNKKQDVKISYIDLNE